MKTTTPSGWLVLLIFCFLLSNSWGQFTVNNAVNANAGVQNVLLGGGITASNITFQGDNAQIGSFSCTAGCGLGIADGLIIGTGSVDGADGPNNSGSFSLGPPSGLDGVGDADLETLSGMTLNNTAILEFDFVPTGDSLSFNYVFSSEEYPEFVNSVNDAFGFFLSGPGIAGPFSNGAINIALIPGSTTPISINTVNDQLNAQYYVDNSGDNALQADGYTTVLAAQAEVICGQTYHIKIVIGDASDDVWDSWVYLEGGSFQSNQLDIAYTAPNLSSPNGGMYEGCEPANLVLTREGGLANAQTYTYTVTGTAQVNVDFTIATPTITFPVGASQVVVPITAIADGVLEGTEQFTFTLNQSSCGAAPYTVDVFIQDLPDLVVTITDTTIQCGGQVSLTPQISGGLGNYLITWADGSHASTYIDNPPMEMDYTFTVSDTCGVAPVNEAAHVDFIQNPPLLVEIGNNISATCLDDINVSSVVSGGYGSYDYEWTGNGALLSSVDSVQFNTGVNVNLVLTVTDECGIETTDAVQVNIPPVPVTVQLGPDLSATCLDVNTLSPTVSGGVGNYTYSWVSSGSTLGSNNTLDFQTATNATVQLQVTDECGNIGNDQMLVNIPPVPVSVNVGPDVVGLCTDAFDFQPIVSGGVGVYTYAWNSSGANLGSQSTLTTTFADDATLTLTVTDECDNTSNDALLVLIPPVAISVNAGPDIVSNCITLNPLSVVASGGVGVLDFSWSDADGFFSSNPNPTYAAPQTMTVTVTATDECNNTGSDNLVIAIPPVPILLTTTPDTTICVNESAFLTGSASGGVGVITTNWNNFEGLGETISVAPTSASNYVFEAYDQCGNEASAEVNVLVTDLQPNFTATYVDEFTVAFENTTQGADYIVWDFGDGDISNEQNPVHTFNTVDTWNVVLTAHLIGSCSKSITQEYYPIGYFYVPNAFTPDGDGINDVFFVKGHDITYYRIVIFDRWGNTVYVGDDLEKPWDGSIQGGDYYAEDGAYNFIITAYDERSNYFERKGVITLIR